MGGYNYKGLKLVKAKRWYVEFYYRIPDGLQKRYDDQEWLRYRKYEDINRIKDPAEKEKYGRLLKAAIKFALENEGYNPLAAEAKLFVKKEGIALTAKVGIEHFKDNISQKSLDTETNSRYSRTADLILEYLEKVGKLNIPFEEVDETLITECLQFYRKSVPWSNRTYNNNLGYFSIIFNFLKKKKKISHNPCDDIEKLRYTTVKHRYYDDKLLPKVTAALKETCPVLYLIAQFVYYAGVRSSKEILNLQVGDILMDRERIRFRITKGKREDYIVLDPKLKEIIRDSGIMNYPEDHYIFDATGIPQPKKSSGAFIPKRFRKVRKKVGLTEDYTLYSFKHTRAVNLLTDGAEPIDIMQLFRHHDLTTTSKYIRDLGFDLNAKFAAKSRDF